jgi:hypothetical protein
VWLVGLPPKFSRSPETLVKRSLNRRLTSISITSSITIQGLCITVSITLPAPRYSMCQAEGTLGVLMLTLVLAGYELGSEVTT